MKYIGSKARFKSELLKIILENRQDRPYVEPFAGGMNVICDVGGVRIANDSNIYLIKMWEALVGGWIPTEFDRIEYHSIRNNPQNYPPHVVGWVGFNCSYSGKWFGGFAGKTATKIGSIRDYQDEAKRNVLKQVEKMRGVTFYNLPYYELPIPPNSVIYCDPPYMGTLEYESKINHEQFWEWVRQLHKGGHTVFVSEYAAPPDFDCVWAKQAVSSLSANGAVGGSKKSTEKLFKYSGG